MTIGELHPVLVHFPIGLVLAAAAAEAAAIFTPWPAWRTVATVNLRAGAAAGVLTAIAGWALASSPSIAPSHLLTWHRWMGLAGATVAVMAALISMRPQPQSTLTVFWYRTALFLAAGLISLAGHLGGTLVWGVDAP